MKLIYTEQALHSLEEALNFIEPNLDEPKYNIDKKAGGRSQIEERQF